MTMKTGAVVLKDEDLFLALEAEASRRRQTVNDLVHVVLQEWLDTEEDRELLPVVEMARSEWQAQGGIEANKFFHLFPRHRPVHP